MRARQRFFGFAAGVWIAGSIATTLAATARAEPPRGSAAPAAAKNNDAGRRPSSREGNTAATPAATGTARNEAEREDRASEEAETSRENAAATVETLPAYESRDDSATSKPGQARGWQVPPGPEPEDALLFGPRALLFVPNLALKLVFMPVRGLAVVLDRYAVVERTIDILYNDERTAAILPTVSWQSGYGLSYGATAFHDDLFGHEERGSLKARYGGLYVQGYEAAFRGDHVGGSQIWIDSVVRYEHKPAMLFQGIGDPPAGGAGATLADPRREAIATRYRQERFLASVGAGVSVGDSPVTKLGPRAIFNHRVFGPEQRQFPEPSIEQVYDTALVPGFDDTLDLLELGLDFVHDSRPKQALPPTGTYVEAFAGTVLPTDRYSFWHTGLEITRHFDLYEGNRVLLLRAAVERVFGPRQDIPFTELPRLGGPQTLRGYLTDRFRDRMAAVATAEYRYPVHESVSGALFVDAGQVAGNLDELERLSHWKLSPGGGFIVHGDKDVILSLQVAYGEDLVVVFSTDPVRAFSKREKEL